MIAPVVAADAIVRQFARHLNLHGSQRSTVRFIIVIELGFRQLNHVGFVIGFWVGGHGESNR